MRLIDIHSHILPGIDDGSKSIEMSIEILEMMKSQGITDVIATPHFDARYDNMDEFLKRREDAYSELKKAANGKALPKIYTGAEVYYFSGIGRSSGIKKLSLAGSEYILLELPRSGIDDSVVKDVEDLSYTLGLTPILAHLERYYDVKGYKKILKTVASGTALAQINAPSIFMPPYKRVVSKLIKKGYVSFLATDTHSPDKRPPMMAEGLSALEDLYGVSQKNMFLRNSDKLYGEIFEKDTYML